MSDILARIMQSRQPNDVDTAAQAAGLRPELVRAVMQQESGGNPNAVSPKGALGLMQVMPATAANPGFGVAPFDPNDPAQNLRGGTQYLKALLDHFGGDEQKALAAYNAGPGTVEKGGPLPAETQHYVAQVTNREQAPQDGGILSRILASRSGPPPATDPGFLSNLGSSAKNFVENTASALVHPLNTLEGLGKTVAGGVEQLDPTDTVKSAVGDQTAYSKALIDFYKKRYGSLDALGHTLYTDPVGAAADAAGALTGGGELLEGANVLAGSSKLADFANLAKETAQYIDPIQGTLKAAAAVTQPIEKATGLRVANAYLKPTATLKTQNPTLPPAEQVLKAGVNFTTGGLNTIKSNIADLSDQYRGVLAADAAQGHTYNPSSIDQALQDFATERSKGDMRDVRRVEGVRQNVLTNNPNRSRDKVVTTMVPQPVQVSTGAVDNAGRPVMQTQMQLTPQRQVVGRELVPQTAEQLDEMKRGLDLANKGKFGAEQPDATVEARKVARHTTDSIIDTNVPGAKELNDQRASAIVARKALAAAIKRKENTYPVGLMGQLSSMMTDAGIFAALDGHPGYGALMAGPALVSSAIKNPYTASALARGAYGLGTAAIEGKTRRVLQNITPAVQVAQATKSNPALTLDAAQRAYQAYLASQH